MGKLYFSSLLPLWIGLSNILTSSLVFDLFGDVYEGIFKGLEIDGTSTTFFSYFLTSTATGVISAT